MTRRARRPWYVDDKDDIQLNTFFNAVKYSLLATTKPRYYPADKNYDGRKKDDSIIIMNV